MENKKTQQGLSLFQAEVASGAVMIAGAIEFMRESGIPTAKLDDALAKARLVSSDLNHAKELFKLARDSSLDELQRYIEQNPPNARLIAYLVLTAQKADRVAKGALGGKTMHENAQHQEKRKKIQEIWASGKYKSRDTCAEQEAANLRMSFSTARKALRGTPDPA